VQTLHPTVPNPPAARPLLVYDGECSFCVWWLARWRRRIGGRVDYEPFQRAASRFPTLPRERFARAVQLIDTDGRVYEGAEAVSRALSLVPHQGLYRWAYEKVPGARPVAERAYRFIADHRPAFYRLTLWIWGDIPLGDRRAGRGPALAALGVAALFGLALRRRRGGRER
jgi:predicted DCC family thiol-disulfide oxidoreductase YuxK